jgi:Domain of unknown function (DUF1707)
VSNGVSKVPGESAAPNMLAGDADRDAAIALLGDALAAGRLTAEEFRSRLDLAATARTFGDLAALTFDLPPAGVRPTESRRSFAARAMTQVTGWKVWTAAVVGLVALDYLDAPGDPLTTPSAALPLNPWPLIVVVPWGLGLIWRELRNQRAAPW